MGSRWPNTPEKVPKKISQKKRPLSGQNTFSSLTGKSQPKVAHRGCRGVRWGMADPAIPSKHSLLEKRTEMRMCASRGEMRKMAENAA